ncbi:MAG: hypothetical protein V3T74_04870 [Gemmatimonadales bacterium]
MRAKEIEIAAGLTHPHIVALAEHVAQGGSERRQLGPGGPEWLPP